jgi:hypothetical protein
LTKSPAMKMLGGAPARMEELVLADGFKLLRGRECVRACEMRNAAVCIVRVEGPPFYRTARAS